MSDQPTTHSPEAWARRLVVRQGTVVRLGAGWEIALQLVYAAKDEHAPGPVARLGLVDASQPGARAQPISARPGMIIEADGRYEVAEIALAAGSPGAGLGHSQNSVTLVPLDGR